MIADLSAFPDVFERQKIAKSMMDVFSEVTRDADAKGWHVEGLVVGILFAWMSRKEATLRLAQRPVTK
jgi:hypothetical protein